MSLYKFSFGVLSNLRFHAFADLSLSLCVLGVLAVYP
jgi:hypothetical protein